MERDWSLLQLVTRPACTSIQFDQALYCWKHNSVICYWIFFNFQINCIKFNAGQWLSTLTKFSMLGVKGLSKLISCSWTLAKFMVLSACIILNNYLFIKFSIELTLFQYPLHVYVCNLAWCYSGWLGKFIVIDSCKRL
jgi:hypothetical protein